MIKCIVRRIAFLVFGVLFVLHLTNYLSHYIIFDRTSYESIMGFHLPFPGFFNPWLNFDGLNYLNLVKGGYAENMSLAAFYPVYPTLIKIVSFNSIINPIIFGLLISYVFSILGIFVFYNLVKADYGKHIALKTISLFLVFPSSFFLFSYYTEGVFFFLAILSFYYMKKDKNLLAALLIAISTATRLFGLALLATFLLRIVKQPAKSRRKWLLPVLLSPTGIVIYSFFLWSKFNNPFLMITAQATSKFGRSVAILNPLMVVPEAIKKIFEGPKVSYDSSFVYPVIILEFVIFLYVVVIIAWSYKKIDTSYWLYMLFSLVLILLGGSFSSIMRYALLLFPAFIFLANKLCGRFFYFFFTLSLVLMVLCASLFFRNYWIA